MRVTSLLRRLIIVAALGACGGRSAPTLLVVRPTFDPALLIDQVRVELRQGGAELPHLPRTMPSVAAGPLSSGRSIDVLLDDGVAGTPLDLEVSGLVAGAVSRYGEMNVLAVAQKETDLELELSLTPVKPTAVLVSISVEAGQSTMAVGQVQQLHATGHYDDGTSAPLDGRAAWSSSDASVVSVTSGLVTAHQVGPAHITAAVDTVMGATDLQVTAAMLQSLELLPQNATIAALTGSQKYQAIATYSDGNKLDIAASVAWSSTSLTVATIDSSGTARALAAGTTTIAAKMMGAPGLSASTQLTVK